MNSLAVGLFDYSSNTMIYEEFDNLGKNNIKSTANDLTLMVGEEGLKDLICKVFMGGNVRDTTEFLTQRRLFYSYAAMLNLFSNCLADSITSASDYTNTILADFSKAKGDAKILDLWLLGLTKKGLDNIVRGSDNLPSYIESFSQSFGETVADMEEKYGAFSGIITIGDVTVDVDWNFILLLSLAMGSQTLSIRGSQKSMNGKLFEKLVLGTLLSIMGFNFCIEPPTSIKKEEKYFWLSNMDENERETDATLVYNGIAISIDIGFIGKGNPEISLDKVTRFNRYKQIAGLGHKMKTIIIVDTVAKGSDLINKAKRVDGIVLQMSQNDWVIDFAEAICGIFNIDHELRKLTTDDLNKYLKETIQPIKIDRFIST